MTKLANTRLCVTRHACNEMVTVASELSWPISSDTSRTAVPSVNVNCRGCVEEKMAYKLGHQNAWRK